MVKKLILSSAFLLVLIGLFGVWYTHHPKITDKQNTPLVQLSAVVTKNIPITVKATGTLVANQKTTLSPKVGGYITHIYFQEGQFVKAGTVLVTLDDTKENQAYLSARAQASLDRSTYNRYLALRKRGVISPQDLDQYKSKTDQSEAAEKSAEVALHEMKLVAPFDGYPGSCSISIGNFVNIGQGLVDITDTNKLKVVFSLPSRYAPLLAIGQGVAMTADFLPGKNFAAKVSYIAPDVDPNTQTIEVHASFDNMQQKLKPGQSVDVTQMLGTRQHALVVPSEALISNINGNYVYTVKNNKVISLPVEVGEYYQNDVVILKGLVGDQPVMTQGQFQVKTGQQVRLSKSG